MGARPGKGGHTRLPCVQQKSFRETPRTTFKTSAHPHYCTTNKRPFPEPDKRPGTWFNAGQTHKHQHLGLVAATAKANSLHSAPSWTTATFSAAAEHGELSVGNGWQEGRTRIPPSIYMQSMALFSR